MSKIARLVPADAEPAKPVVIALHCSGGSGRQWRHLTEALGGGFDVIAPDLFGCGTRGHWSGEGPFRLTDEAALIVDIIDNCEGPVHLVGHSYGGGVALRAAVERSTRIASLSLYEPTAFHMLKAIGPDGHDHLAEIRGVAGNVASAVVNGNYRAAARRFVDYWNGQGAWNDLRPEHQAELVRYIPEGLPGFPRPDRGADAAHRVSAHPGPDAAPARRACTGAHPGDRAQDDLVHEACRRDYGCRRRTYGTVQPRADRG